MSFISKLEAIMGEILELEDRFPKYYVPFLNMAKFVRIQTSPSQNTMYGLLVLLEQTKKMQEKLGLEIGLIINHLSELYSKSPVEEAPFKTVTAHDWQDFLADYPPQLVNDKVKEKFAENFEDELTREINRSSKSKFDLSGEEWIGRHAYLETVLFKSHFKRLGFVLKITIGKLERVEATLNMIGTNVMKEIHYLKKNSSRSNKLLIATQIATLEQEMRELAEALGFLRNEINRLPRQP